MLQGAQFSSGTERWSEISDFPGYSISDWGRVLSSRTDRPNYITPTRNSHGALMVGLMRPGGQAKRSLALLVAQHFLPKPTNEAFNTPMHLDGDRDNCHYQNLMWRPLWFARRYMQQFSDNHLTCNDPIEDVETGIRYKCSMDAAVANGILDKEICLTMMNNGYVWPTGQVFRKAIER